MEFGFLQHLRHKCCRLSCSWFAFGRLAFEKVSTSFEVFVVERNGKFGGLVFSLVFVKELAEHLSIKLGMSFFMACLGYFYREKIRLQFGYFEFCGKLRLTLFFG